MLAHTNYTEVINIKLAITITHTKKMMYYEKVATLKFVNLKIINSPVAED